MKRIVVFYFIIFLTILSTSGLCDDVIVMVYRPTEKVPYIKAEPSNDGLYKAIFSQAAKKIGLGFEIKRYPKKRAYLYLEQGTADFYPGASFNAAREQIGYFINNRMAIKGGMLLYRDDIEIESISDIKGYTLLYNLGGTTIFFDLVGVDVKANKLREIPKLGIARAITILQVRTGDFYAYDLTALEAYFNQNEAKGIKKYPVRFKHQVDYLIFSKKSRYYREKPNPHYDPGKMKSIDNLPYTLDEHCVAFKFQETLKSMEKSGEIDRLYRKVMGM